MINPTGTRPFNATIFARLLFLSLAFLGLSACSNAKIDTFWGLNKKVLVVCARFADHLSVRQTGYDWVNKLNEQIDPFWQNASDGHATLNFVLAAGPTKDALGWFTLPITQAEWEANLKTDPVANIRIAFALTTSRVGDINHVVVIVNGKKPDGTNQFGATTYGYQYMPTNIFDAEYIHFNRRSIDLERLMAVSAMNEWDENGGGYPYPGDAGVAVCAHEMGHQFYFPEHYATPYVTFNGAFTDSISPWDVMGESPTLNQWLAYLKEAAPVIVPGDPRIVTMGPTITPVDTTLRLYPISSDHTGIQIIKVPLPDIPSPIVGPFQGYVIEYRKNISGFETLNYDGTPMREGALVTYVDETRSDPRMSGQPVVVVANPDFPGDLNNATLQTDELVADAVNGISIYVSEVDSDSMLVEVRAKARTVAAHPYIRPGVGSLGSPDIWVDSPLNGFGVLRYVDGNNNAVGPGDDPWVGHVNRVYVRLQSSDLPAHNVRVRVSEAISPGLAGKDSQWSKVGDIVIQSLGSQTAAVGYVDWIPKSSQVSLKAEILPDQQYVSPSGFAVVKNVQAAELKIDQPGVALPIHASVINSDLQRPALSLVTPIGIPQGWSYSQSSDHLMLQPGAVSETSLSLSRLRGGQAGSVGNFALSLVDSRVQGDDFSAHASQGVLVSSVKSTRISLRVTSSGYSGQLTDLWGLGIGGQTVALSMPNGLLHTTTDPSGRFKFALQTSLSSKSAADVIFPGTKDYASCSSMLKDR